MNVCQRCHLQTQKPYEVSCGHKFCNICLSAFFLQDELQCPIDKQTFSSVCMEGMSETTSSSSASTQQADILVAEAVLPYVVTTEFECSNKLNLQLQLRSAFNTIEELTNTNAKMFKALKQCRELFENMDSTMGNLEMKLNGLQQCQYTYTTSLHKSIEENNINFKKDFKEFTDNVTEHALKLRENQSSLSQMFETVTDLLSGFADGQDQKNRMIIQQLENSSGLQKQVEFLADRIDSMLRSEQDKSNKITQQLDDTKVLQKQIECLGVKLENMEKNESEKNNKVIRQLDESSALQKQVECLIKKIVILERSEEEKNCKIIKQFAEAQVLQRQVDTLEQKIEILEKKDSGEINKFTKQLDDSKLLQKQIDILQTKLESIEKKEDERKCQSLKVQDDLKSKLETQMAVAYECFSSNPSVCPFLWKIEKFTHLQENARSGKGNVIYSDNFYTQAYGYKMRLFIYPIGSPHVGTNYLSCFVQILKGPMDAVLKWPVDFTCSFTLLDQLLEEDHHTVTISFIHAGEKVVRRPVADQNSGTGVPKFFPLDKLKPKYLIDNILFLKFDINT